MVYSREQSCVICMTPSKDNVLLCQDGHSGCRSCAERQSASDGCCPQCVGPLWKPDGEWVPNRVLNNLMVHVYEGKAAKQRQLNELKRAARRGAAAVVEPIVVEAQPEHSRQQQQRESARSSSGSRRAAALLPRKLMCQPQPFAWSHLLRG